VVPLLGDRAASGAGNAAIHHPGLQL